MKKLCDAYSRIPERGNHVEVHVAIDIGDFADVTVIELIVKLGDKVAEGSLTLVMETSGAAAAPILDRGFKYEVHHSEKGWAKSE